MVIIKVSIIVTVFNEVDYLEKQIKAVEDVPLSCEKEIIIVDDCSTDGSTELIDKYKGKYKIYFHDKRNMGKGAAIKTGASHATGDIILTQDADLEYDVSDIQACIQPILDGKADIVYGSRRLMSSNKHSNLSFTIGGIGLTYIFNILYFRNMSDLPTGYKVYKKSVYDSVLVGANRFDWEYEITPKLAKKGYKFAEVPIHYYPRPVAAGKKIKYMDGVICAWTLLKWRFKR